MLTWAERLILWNQYEILKHFNSDNEHEVKDFERCQEILSNGYELYYGEVNNSIYPDTLSVQDGKEVQDILDVYRAIHFSCERLKYKPKSHWATFEGFDANNDGGQYSFACFLRRTLGRWDELKDCPDNSHSSASLPYYKRMVAAWKRLDRKSKLTEAEIEQIAEAT